MKTFLILSAVVSATVVGQEAPKGVRVEREFNTRVQFAPAEGPATVQFISRQLMDGAPVKNAPYAAEAVTESTQVLPDGNKIVNRSSSFQYRDSEGRERREESLPVLGAAASKGAPLKMIFISDPVAKASYTLDPQSKTVHKMTMAALPPEIGAAAGAQAQDILFRSIGGVASGLALPAAGGGGKQVMVYEQKTVGAPEEPKTESLGKKNIEGVIAEGSRTRISIAAGQVGNERPMEIISERWYSPELQMAVMTRHSDPRFGETIFRLTNISRAEPSRMLFEVPADYKAGEDAAQRIEFHKVEKVEGSKQ